MVSRDTIPGTVVSTDDLTDDILTSLPGGVKAYKTVTENSGGFRGQEVTITGYDTGNITLDDNRIYRVSFQVAIQQTTPDPDASSWGNFFRIWLTDGGNNHLVYVDDLAFPNETRCIGRTYLDIDPGAGNRRYKLRGEVTLAIDNCLVFAAADQSIPGWIKIEDCGPSTGYS